MKNSITLNQIAKVESKDSKTLTNKTVTPLRVGSAFTGIGAFELAMTNIIEFSSEFIVEWDSKAKQTFLSNFNTKKVFNDITKINLDEIPKVDIFCFTPSCISFSFSGLQHGFNSESGKLVFDALKIIEKTTPKYVVYENVKAMVSKKFIKSFENILKILSDLGYETHWKVLNSHDYGLAQNRERVYLVGILGGGQNFDFPEPTTPDIKESINDIMVNTDYSEYIYKEKLEKFIPKRDSFIKTGYTIPRLAAYTGDSKVYLTSGISPTLRTGNRDHFYDTKNNLFRRLTLEELTALQGFPSTFNWPVGIGKTARRKQIGNSVSVPVFESILRELLKDYLKPAPKVVNQPPASINNAGTPTKTISLLQTIKQKEGYVSGPIITQGIKAIRKTATDRTTEIIKAHIDRPLLSKNMYINQALINYSKDQDIFDKIEAMDSEKLTTYLKDRDSGILNFDSFADDSNTKKFTLFPYAGGKLGVNKQSMQTLIDNAFKTKKYTRFIDSFAGGLGATYNVLPILLKNNVKEIVVNDINKSIINVYRQVQRSPKQVQRQLASISLEYFKEFGKFAPETREEARALHIKLEAEFKQLELDKKMNPRRSALFLALMQKSTAGMLDCFLNTQTCFFETINIDLLINKVALYNKILNSTKFKFKSVKYQTLFKTYKNNADTLMIIDPPYIEYQEKNETTAGCSFSYGINSDQKELLTKVKSLKCDFIYYNNHNPLIENFAKKHHYSYIKNSRTFANNSEDRTKSVEICMTKLTPANPAMSHTTTNCNINTRQVA